jgi:hypothetical protein
MGVLRSMKDHSGMKMDGVLLSSPVRDYDEDGEVEEGSEYRWDDPRIPSGVIDDDGTITLDETEDV